MYSKNQKNLWIAVTGRTAAVALGALMAVGACSSDSNKNGNAGGSGGGALGGAGGAGGSPGDQAGSRDAAAPANGGSTGTRDAAPNGNPSDAPVTTDGARGGGVDGGAAPVVTACTITIDKTKPISAPSAGRKVYCGIEIGSRTAKLLVDTMIPGMPLSIKEERSCRTQLDFGVKVYDATTMAMRPLGSEEIDRLLATLVEYKSICALDGGTIVGMTPGEWGRRATNRDEIDRAVKEKTGLTLDRATAEEEGLYGYIATTKGAANRLVLDPGSNSFQLSWKVGDAPMKTFSIPLGYAQAGMAYFSNPMTKSYEEARTAYLADVGKRMMDAKPLGLADLKADLPKLGKEIL